VAPPDDKPSSEKLSGSDVRDAIKHLLGIAAAFEREDQKGSETVTLAADKTFLSKIVALALDDHAANAPLAREGNDLVTHRDIELWELTEAIAKTLRDCQNDPKKCFETIAWKLEYAGLKNELTIEKVCEAKLRTSRLKDSTITITSTADFVAFVSLCRGPVEAARFIVHRFGGPSGSHFAAVQKYTDTAPNGDLLQLFVASRGGFVSRQDAARYALRAIGFPEGLIEKAVAELGEDKDTSTWTWVTKITEPPTEDA
jgi:hypothetical protein